MPAHTPGPWGYVKGRNGKPGGVVQVIVGHAILSADGLEYDSDYVSREQADANARLIAAAPALLEALEAIAHQLTAGEASEGNHRDIAWCAQQARAAIAQAKGEMA